MIVGVVITYLTITEQAVIYAVLAAILATVVSINIGK